MSRRDVSEYKHKVERLVEKFLGFPEPVLAATALNCLSNGYDKKKTSGKLSALLESHKAEKLADKVLSLLDMVRDRKDSKKRHHESSPDVDIKRSRNDDKKDSLTSTDIKSMMANAQRTIQERKKALTAIKRKSTTPPKNMPQTGSALQRDEKQRKIALLQAQIKNKLSTGVIGGVDLSKLEDKPTPLILNSEGRTVDSSGKEIKLTNVVPTLKANIRAKKRQEFKTQLSVKPHVDNGDVQYYDPRISLRPQVRNRKSLKFHEPGKFQQMAERMRMKAQLQKLQGEISQIAKRTGIQSATKLAQIAPKIYIGPENIPDVEWWDSVILVKNTYGKDDEEFTIKEESITHLIEHPIQMKAPTLQSKAAYMPVFLTKKERKKLRRQNRREAWKEEQEKIRLGLEPAPEPKLRISNLMRALGTEAVQDPTKMEAHVKAQMAKRIKAHEDANASRKLSAAQRSEKRRKRLMEDTTFGVHVSLYRIKDLTNMTKKFKVEVNCKQLFMTGCVILYKDCNVVIVEGGPKQTSTYQRLMLKRIKWEEDIVKDSEGKETPNSCVLVWQGMKQNRNFGEIKFKPCVTEGLAREMLRKHNVEHYWDLAYSGTVMIDEEK